MPLSKSGTKILKKMEKEYGKKHGKQVFYATQNKRKSQGKKSWD